jgi:hypothetical protein
MPQNFWVFEVEHNTDAARSNDPNNGCYKICHNWKQDGCASVLLFKRVRMCSKYAASNPVWHWVAKQGSYSLSLLIVFQTLSYPRNSDGQSDLFYPCPEKCELVLYKHGHTRFSVYEACRTWPNSLRKYKYIARRKLSDPIIYLNRNNSKGNKSLNNFKFSIHGNSTETSLWSNL